MKNQQYIKQQNRFQNVCYLLHDYSKNNHQINKGGIQNGGN